VSAGKQLNPGLVGGAIGALLAVLLGYALLNLNFPLGKKLIHLSYDLPFLFRPHIYPDEVCMVYLNDDAHRALNQPLNKPWDREIHARLVERMTALGARAVVFDIIFSDPAPNRAADEHFAQAIKQNGRVILAADYVPMGFGLAEGMRLTMPCEQLREAAAGWGITQLKGQPDFLVRQHYHGPMLMDSPVFSESWAAAALVGAKAAKNPDERSKERWVNYYGPPNSLPSFGIHQVVEPEGVLLSEISNKVVFVGARLNTLFSGDRKDEFISPYTVITKTEPGEDTYMSGAQVHATIFLNLLRGDWLVRSPGRLELIGVVLLGIAFGYGLVQLRPLVTLIAAPLLMLIIASLAYMLFAEKQLWFPWLIVVAQIFIALLWAIGFNSIQLYVQKRLYEHTLSLYLSPKLVKKFANDRKFLKPGAEKQQLSIMFTDIENFTKISEGMDSDELAQLMNNYFERAISCVHQTDGALVKLIGDALFAVWNAPLGQPDHQERVCRTALLLRDDVLQFTAGDQGKRLRTRIGIHTGVANIGNFGSTKRFDWTAIGENINLAARMEGLNKYLGTDVLATREAQSAVDGRMVTRLCGHFRLKGFEKTVEVYELVGFPEQAEATRAWRELFADALKAFQRKDWDSAEAGFHRTLATRPEDGPSKFYLARIAELRVQTLPEGWAGEVELKEK
jgi:adenylate cyclase